MNFGISGFDPSNLEFGVVQDSSEFEDKNLQVSSPCDLQGQQASVLPTQVKTMTWEDYLGLLGNVLSLDISKTSTGWVRYVDGNLAYGNIVLKSGVTNREARREFREDILQICGDHEFDLILIEMPIDGLNFETNLILYQLNAIPEDLVDMGLIKAKAVEREGNSVWKKYLREAADYEPEIKGASHSKEDTIACNERLGLFLDIKTKHREDVNDAFGMLIGYAKRIHLNKEVKKKKVKTNLDNQFKLKAFSPSSNLPTSDIEVQLTKEVEKLQKRGKAKDFPRLDLDFSHTKSDLIKMFKEKVEELENSDFIFVIKANSVSLGRLAVNFLSALDEEVVYLLATPK